MFLDQINDKDWFAPFVGETTQVEDGFIYDFLGGKSDVKYNASKIKTINGRVTPVPLGNVEFGCLLWAVKTSGSTFTMAEMGAGFGIWSVRGALAAKNLNKKYKLICVEGEKTHYNWLREHCANNSLNNRSLSLVHGVVGAEDGYCLFPIAGEPDVQWGLRALNVKPGEIENIESSNRLQLNDDGTYSLKKHLQLKYEGAKSFSIRKLLGTHKVVDFVHFDIQGSELEAISANVNVVNEKIRIMYVATHSPEIEVGLRDLLPRHGWEKLFDEPQKLRSNGYMGDGEQIWFNTKFAI